ncbi:hypothetical protein J8F10_10185 [Gemmata sp. G18]|uniref:Uncharacterized protein n=1 Tax=Gemmata palustris TaxID=2822762 RepID=A0ABS5BS10_9BACT|nr:hypothetical protein [Gemmata palustris]MBP3955648.1 hypothetical protein [Gemmata palustris]
MARLPRAGLLSFFYHDDRGPLGKGSRVFFFPPKRLHRAHVVVDPRYGVDFHDRHLYPRLLTLSQGYRVPDRIQRYGLTRRERDVWKDRKDARGATVIGGERDEFGYFHEMFHNRFSPATHRLFGLPSYEAKYPVPRGHLLLASFGSMADRINFYVPKSSVEELEFGKVKVAYECT